jgi:predicted nucleic acid-binding protein
MEKPILLDTDVLVDFFRGLDKAVAFINKYNDRIILSSIVVAELYAGVKGDAEQNALQNFISLFRVVPIDAAIGKAGGGFIDEIMASHLALDLQMLYWLQPLNLKMLN